MSDNERFIPSSFNTFYVINHTPSLDDTLKALRIAVEQLLTSNKPPEMDLRRHFYKTFNQEADEYDRDFHKKYHDDLNTTLIFVSGI